MRYLFLAEFQDGQRIAQTSEDKSITNVGSAFSDVLAYGQPLAFFSLIGEGKVWSLNFRTLTFSIDGHQFQTHDTTLYPLTEVKVEYARVMEQDIQVDAKSGLGKAIGGRCVGFKLGWSGKDRFGREVKHLVYIP